MEFVDGERCDACSSPNTITVEIDVHSVLIVSPVSSRGQALLVSGEISSRGQIFLVSDGVSSSAWNRLTWTTFASRVGGLCLSLMGFLRGVRLSLSSMGFHALLGTGRSVQASSGRWGGPCCAICGRML